MFHSLYTFIRDFCSAPGQVLKLQTNLDEKAGHIKALEGLLKNKEEFAAALSQDLVQCKAASTALEEARSYQESRKRYYKTVLRKALVAYERAKKENHSLTAQCQAFAKQMGYIEQLEGRFWEASPGDDIPAFRPRQAGCATIIAVANLKGGVGKTTLTANLGATLWSKKKRVLLVDLDYQHSLTNLCLPADAVRDTQAGPGRLVEQLFRAQHPGAESVLNLLTRVGETSGYLLPCSEELANIEEHMKAKWLLQTAVGDVRYLLRAALHHPAIQDRFDYILLDCPPRLTLASINALTCSDYVLVPVLPDKTSTAGVPRFLHWLRILRGARVCPQLALLGVLANGTQNKTRFTSRERDLWAETQRLCSDAWKEPAYFFDRFLPKKILFAEAAESKAFAALDRALKPIFAKLVAEFHKRTSLHASQQPAGVS